MVGRAAELRELEALLQWAVGGRGRAAYVMGDAGMGKTTLIEAVADPSGGDRNGGFSRLVLGCGDAAVLAVAAVAA